MHPIILRRFNLAIEVLTNLKDEEFVMNTWKGDTVGCTIGWCASHHLFNALGFSMEEVKGRVVPFLVGGFTEWDAICKFFGLDIHEAHYLFHPRQYIVRSRAAVIVRLNDFIKDRTFKKHNLQTGVEWPIATTHNYAMKVAA